MEADLRRLESEVRQLQWEGRVHSTYGSSMDPCDPRHSIPLRDVVMQIANYLGVCVDVRMAKGPEARVFKKGGPEKGNSV
jgi:hypothetical protein